MKHWLLIPLAVFALGFSGCSDTLATIKKVYSAGTVTTTKNVADKIISDAEKLELVSKDTFSTYLRLEKDHREAYGQVSPKFQEFSIWLRTRVPDPYDVGGGDPPSHFVPRDVAMLLSVHKATDEFRANRTPANEANLMTVYKTLKSAFDDCKKYTTQITTGVKP